MANFLMVSFGLSGPVTHPTIDVPGGAGGGARGRYGDRNRLSVRAAVAVVGGVGCGITPTCCCTCPVRGDCELGKSLGS